MNGWEEYWPRIGSGEDWMHTQLREYWVATGQLSPAYGHWPVDADGFRNLGFLASWGYVPSTAADPITDPGWGLPLAPEATVNTFFPGPADEIPDDYVTWSRGWS